MKTEKQIRSDIAHIIENTKKGKKPRIDNLIQAIKIVKTISESDLLINIDLAKNELKLIENKLKKRLILLNDTNHSKNQDAFFRKISSEFRKEKGVSRLKRQIKEMNYILND